MKVLFMTGAGISANAGVPTYRDGGSSWKDKDLEAKSHSNRYGNHLDELWDKHWGPVEKVMKQAEPTIAHKAIAEFQKNHEVIVATQNIDDLHERAGSDNIAHVHGMMDAFCMRCKSHNIRQWDGTGAPQCFDCGSRKTRPGVVLFGEMLSGRMMRGLTKFAAQADHVVAVGTSLNVFPAAALVMDNIAKATIINMEPTKFDRWAANVYTSDADTVIYEALDNLNAV